MRGSAAGDVFEENIRINGRIKCESYEKAKDPIGGTSTVNSVIAQKGAIVPICSRHVSSGNGK